MTASTPAPQESRPAASASTASSSAGPTTPAASSAAGPTTPAASSTAVTTSPAATPAAAPAAPAKATPAKTAPPRPPAPPRPKSNGSGVAGGAFVTAVCALLVAIGAIGVAVYSLKVARDALSKNADQAPALATPATSTTAAAPIVVPTEPAPTVSVPRVQYFSELVRAELEVAAPSGCNAAYVDVDTMATGVDAGHEFYLSTCKDPATPEFRVDRTSGASPSSANPNPDVCGALIAGTQSTQELVLTAKAGLTFCLLTNKSDATAQNLPQRLAIVEVRNVAVDRTVTIAVSTFRIG
jgi:hypothetical protein